jgi:M6 family metalloprotease-like protein
MRSLRPRRSRRNVRGGVTVCAAVVVSLIAIGATPAATYPSPPHDFSHPGTPHDGFPFADFFNSTAGQEDRPLLVIYARWNDVGYPTAFDAQTVASRFFGTGLPSTTFPSVGDYFRRLSFNKLYVFPAQETQGTPNDGVVQVHVPGTKAEFFALSNAARNRRLLELADPFVDFASFDTDGNGSLSSLELAVNAYEAAPETPLWQGSGIAAEVAAVTLDGVALGGLRAAMTNTSTNLITIIHENAHVLAGMPDLYGFGVGRLDLGGPTSGQADSTLFAPNAWQKLHWGWITPAVVTRDGFYEVRRADTTGDAFILYDPDRGTDDYFIVENRTMTLGTYDQGASDRGLVIWRVADAWLGRPRPIEFGRPIELMLPDGSPAPDNWGGWITDAWDPADPGTPQRTMARRWADNTASRVAVRAIGPAGDVIRAYFDVPGPGILVDTYPLDREGPVRATAGRSRTIDVPIMNTGETCDTFAFEAIDLPAGWTMSPGARILCGGESDVSRLSVTPAADAAVGVYEIAIRGRSMSDPTVTTVSPLSVDVVLLPTKFGLADLVTVSPTGTFTTFQVSLAAADDSEEPAPAGVPVTWTLSGPGGTITLDATTDAGGVARATSYLTLSPGSYSLTIESERRREFGSTSTTVTFAVLSLEEAIRMVADELQTRIDSATNGHVAAALRSALYALLGNHAITPPTNGALDKLEENDSVSAITKIRAAISNIITAESRGAGDLSHLKDLLGLVAEGIATGAFQEAHAAIPTPSSGQTRTLATIASLIATGHQQLENRQYLRACDSFRQATEKSLELMK